MNQIEVEVDRLFGNISGQRGDRCMNPVTGGWFVLGEDPLPPQKETARKALLAREWFAKHGPPDAPPLPLSNADIEDFKYGRGAFRGIIARHRFAPHLADLFGFATRSRQGLETQRGKGTAR